MGKKVRSARGELVDFDYLKIKEQLATSPPPIEVKERQDFIENKLRRRTKKAVITPEPKLPAPSDDVYDTVDVPVSDEDQSTSEKEAVPVTKQKARRRKTT